MTGGEYYGHYSAPYRSRSDKPNPVSHVAYGYATQAILGEDGRLVKAHCRPRRGQGGQLLSVEGQIEGGVMSMGFAPYGNIPGKPCFTAKYGTLGLFRADMIPEVQAVTGKSPASASWRHRPGRDHLHPHRPAIAEAYYQFDGKRRHSSPRRTPTSGRRSNSRLLPGFPAFPRGGGRAKFFSWPRQPWLPGFCFGPPQAGRNLPLVAGRPAALGDPPPGSGAGR